MKKYGDVFIAAPSVLKAIQQAEKNLNKDAFSKIKSIDLHGELFGVSENDCSKCAIRDGENRQSKL